MNLRRTRRRCSSNFHKHSSSLFRLKEEERLLEQLEKKGAKEEAVCRVTSIFPRGEGKLKKRSPLLSMLSPNANVFSQRDES